MPPPAEESEVSTADAPESSAEEAPDKRPPPGHVRETVVIIVLSITAVLTAWCGFESSKWSGGDVHRLQSGLQRPDRGSEA